MGRESQWRLHLRFVLMIAQRYVGLVRDHRQRGRLLGDARHDGRRQHAGDGEWMQNRTRRRDESLKNPIPVQGLLLPIRWGNSAAVVEARFRQSSAMNLDAPFVIEDNSISQTIEMGISLIPAMRLSRREINSTMDP